MEKRILWASDAAYLNDAAELQTGRNLLQFALETVFAGVLNQDDPAFHSLERLLEDLRTDQYILLNSGPVYVCSFSEDGDSLSQWRAYGNYAIGFDEDLLKQAQLVMRDDLDRPHHAEMRNSTVARVQYVDAEHASGLVNEISSWVHEELHGLTMSQLLKSMTEFLVRLKVSAFSEEKERRLRYIPAPLENDVKVKYRLGQFSITPYVEYSVLKEAIGRVMVGPGPHQQLEVAAINRLLRDEGYDPRVYATPSAIPYRT